MKKIIILPLVVLLCFLCLRSGGKELSASEIKETPARVTTPYVNLLDINKIKYDEVKGAFSYPEGVSIKKNHNYTFIFAREFFGICEEDGFHVLGRRLKNHFIDENGQESVIELQLLYSECSYVYATFRSEKVGKLYIDDFITRGRNLDTLGKDMIIFYDGSTYDFKGFRKNADLTGYGKVNDFKIYTDYDNPLKLKDITDNLVLYDPQTGILGSDALVLTNDDYTNHEKSIGDHLVTYEGTDPNGVKTVLNITIKVVDVTPPEITGEDEMIWDCSQPQPKLEDIIKNYEVTDNQCLIDKRTIYIESSTLNTYYQNKIKDYEVNLAVRDAAGNVGKRKITIKATDTEPPVLEVREVQIPLSKLGTGAANLLHNVIVKVEDNCGDYTIGYAWNYKGGELCYGGKFPLEIIAQDNVGNETSKTTYVEIIDDIGPEFYVKSFLMETTQDKPLSVDNLHENIKKNLKARGILFDSVCIIDTNYGANQENVGSYQIKYLYGYGDNINYEVAAVNVLHKDSDNLEFNYWYLALALPVVLGIGIAIRRRKRHRLIQ